MTNPSYNKVKGAKFEIDIMNWFRSKGVKAERLRLAGKDDEGDLVAIIGGTEYVFELKNVAKIDLPNFWRQATTEAANYSTARGLAQIPPAYVIVKRRNGSLDDAWVIQNLNQWLEVTRAIET
jgi:hypothetical protein